MTDFEAARERGRRAAEEAMNAPPIEEREAPPRREEKRLTREERIALMETSKPLPAAIRNRLLGIEPEEGEDVQPPVD